MDQDRLKWITRKPVLSRVEMVVHLADTPQGLLATVSCHGHSATRRGSLWHHSETIPVMNDRYRATDLCHHLLLVALEDRPRNNTELTRGLIGATWEQPELPF